MNAEPRSGFQLEPPVRWVQQSWNIILRVSRRGGVCADEADSAVKVHSRVGRGVLDWISFQVKLCENMYQYLLT